MFSGWQTQFLYAASTYEADLWEWSGSRWSRIDAVGPPSRANSAMTLDLDRQRIVLFGGRSPEGWWLGDTWEVDGVGWIQAPPALSPPPTAACVLAYDPLRRRTVLLGTFSSSSTTVASGTWEWDGITWLQRGLAVQPPARSSTAMVFDLGRGKIVLYG